MPKKLLVIILYLQLIIHWTNAQEKLPDRIITLPAGSWTVENLLHFLEDRYQIMFSYIPEEIPLKSEIKLPAGKTSLSRLLDISFSDKDITWSFVAMQVVLKKNIKTKNKFTVNGKISDAMTGESLIGANIYITSMEVGTTSNSYGFYSITLPESNIARHAMPSVNQLVGSN